MRIDAKGLHYKLLNEQIRLAIKKGEKEIILDNVNGQRYIGDGIKDKAKIIINGVSGNDLAAFMDGLHIVVNGNGQDGLGNTMSSGEIIIHGDAGDIAGHSMRGGKIYIKGEVGYRIGIHMKSYKELYPVIIVGGCAYDFLGEYMAGGLLIVLGLNKTHDQPIVGNYVGTGMHGGTMYIRGELEEYQLGKEVRMFEPDENDKKEIRKYLKEYCQIFDLNLEDIMNKKFTKLIPFSHRPYGRLYAY